jgi:hypothetical protein
LFDSAVLHEEQLGQRELGSNAALPQNVGQNAAQNCGFSENCTVCVGNYFCEGVILSNKPKKT